MQRTARATADGGRDGLVRLVMTLLLLSPGLLAQGVPDSFVIDKSKPFAYLVFDHIGPRKPAQLGEGSEGIWLRVVDNCRIPIVFRSESAPEGDSGSTLEDEVVPVVPMLEILLTPEELDASKQRSLDRREALKHKPDGYQFEVSGVLRIEPGKDALFSVPRNHVGRFWFMRVKFALEVSRSALSIGPFTYLDFYDYQIPKKK
jgi:hypothetical protein